MKMTIDDILEINERMIGYYGIDICFSNGFSGYDLDLEQATFLKDVINELLAGKERGVFKYSTKKPKKFHENFY